MTCVHVLDRPLNTDAAALFLYLGAAGCGGAYWYHQY